LQFGNVCVWFARVKGAKKERKEGKEKKKREKATVKRTRTPDTDCI
jgi:hypothetical protein